MPTATHSQTRSHVHPPRREKKKNTTQTISLMVGFLLFIIGLAGLLYPAFMGLHLSIFHSLLITTAGATLFYNGYKVNSRGAFTSCLGFGILFALFSLSGFIFGQPGQPTVGFQAFDPRTLDIISGVESLGTLDHILNAVIGVILLIGAYDWSLHRRNLKTIF